MPVSSASGRIIRRFSRFGIGAAVLVLVGGILATGIVARHQYDRAQGAALPEIKPSLLASPPSVSHQPPPGFTIDQPPPRVGFAEAENASAIGLGITAVLALATWGFFRSLGRVVARFARD